MILGVLLKVVSLLTVVASAVGCTLVSVNSGSVEAYIFLGCIWGAIALVAMVAWGAGEALIRAHKLKKKLERLEQQITALSRVSAAAPMPQRKAEPDFLAELLEISAEDEPQKEVPAAPVCRSTHTQPSQGSFSAPKIPKTLPDAPRRSTPPVPPPAPKSNKWIFVLVAVILVVVAVGGGLGYVLGGREEVPAVRDTNTNGIPAAPTATPARDNAADAIPLTLGQSIDNADFTMTFDSLELLDGYSYSTGENISTSLYVEEGYRLLLLKGHFTNNATSAISESVFVRSALVNGSYEVDGYDVRLGFERNKYFEIDPYTDLNYVLYINIPEKLAEAFETVTFTLEYREDLSVPTTTWNADGTVTNDTDKAYTVTASLDGPVAVPAAPVATEAAPAAEAPAAEAPSQSAKAIAIGQTIVTDQYEFTLRNVELTYEVLPPNTSSVYASYPAESGKVFVHVEADVKNTMKRNITIDELFKGSVVYDGAYPYSGTTIVNDGDNRFDWVGSYVAASPLETCRAHSLVECPDEVDWSGKSIVVNLDLGGTTYSYTLR